jgi:hypothetical protein
MVKPFEAYENLKEKLGEEQAKAVIEYIETTTKQGLATKDDIYRLELKIESIKSELIKWMIGVGIGIVALLSVLRFTGKA